MDRRDFVFLSSGAAFGNMLVPGLADPEHEHEHGTVEQDLQPKKMDWSKSGLVTGKPKPLKHKEIPGFLSAEQIAPHHTAHYGGALKGYGAADAKLIKASNSGEAVDGATFGALKRAVNSKGNSVVLHELYFDGLTPKIPDPEPGIPIRVALSNRFGSVEKWYNDFIASAKSAAGWAMLVRHPVNGKLYNVVSDEHSMGVVWMATPLIVIDTYEHAFYIDYENRKSEYVEKFLGYVDWDVVNDRLRSTL